MFTYCQSSTQSSGAVWKSRWTSWFPVPNKPTVSVDVKQHFSQLSLFLASEDIKQKQRTVSAPSLEVLMVSVDVKQHWTVCELSAKTHTLSLRTWNNIWRSQQFQNHSDIDTSFFNRLKVSKLFASFAWSLRGVAVVIRRTHIYWK